MVIMQGDAYDIPINIYDENGEAITSEMVDTVEVTFGTLTKTYPSQVTYDEGVFYFPITQQESFALADSFVPQVRVKLISGDVFGTYLDLVVIAPSESNEVL